MKNLWKNVIKSSSRDEHRLTYALMKNQLFQGLSTKELSLIAERLYERIYLPQEWIFEENDRGFGMYLIAQGSVSIEALVDEKPMRLAELQSGHFFGELALIESNNFRTAGAKALNRSVILGFFQPDLEELLQANPKLGVKILRRLSIVLARRLIETNTQLAKKQTNSHE